MSKCAKDDCEKDANGGQLYCGVQCSWWHASDEIRKLRKIIGNMLEVIDMEHGYGAADINFPVAAEAIKDTEAE